MDSSVVNERMYDFDPGEQGQSERTRRAALPGGRRKEKLRALPAVGDARCRSIGTGQACQTALAMSLEHCSAEIWTKMPVAVDFAAVSASVSMTSNGPTSTPRGD